MLIHCLLGCLLKASQALCVVYFGHLGACLWAKLVIARCGRPLGPGNRLSPSFSARLCVCSSPERLPVTPRERAEAAQLPAGWPMTALRYYMVESLTCVGTASFAMCYLLSSICKMPLMGPCKVIMLRVSGALALVRGQVSRSSHQASSPCNGGQRPQPPPPWPSQKTNQAPRHRGLDAC